MRPRPAHDSSRTVGLLLRQYNNIGRLFAGLSATARPPSLAPRERRPKRIRARPILIFRSSPRKRDPDAGFLSANERNVWIARQRLPISCFVEKGGRAADGT